METKSEKLLKKAIGEDVEIDFTPSCDFEEIMIAKLNGQEWEGTPNTRMEELLLQMDLTGASQTSPIINEGNWNYRLMNHNTFECWYKKENVRVDIKYQSGNFYRSDNLQLKLPQTLIDNYEMNIMDCNISVAHSNFPTTACLASLASDGVNYYAISGATREGVASFVIMCYCFGTYADK